MPLPLDTLPAGIKEALTPVLKDMFIAFTSDFEELFIVYSIPKKKRFFSKTVAYEKLLVNIIK